MKIKSRIWIEAKNGTYLGEGRIALLENILETGSISKAAKNMNMSYNKALKLVNSMNELGEKPLVLRSIGGTGGGGTSLTSEGIEAIKFYKTIKEKTDDFMNQELKNSDFK